MLWALDKNLLNLKTNTIPRYGKLVSKDFQMHVFFLNLWKIDENTHIFLIHGFWDIFRVKGKTCLVKRKIIK